MLTPLESGRLKCSALREEFPPARAFQIVDEVGAAAATAVAPGHPGMKLSS